MCQGAYFEFLAASAEDEVCALKQLTQQALESTLLMHYDVKIKRQSDFLSQCGLKRDPLSTK
jgi:hypothetical protein